MTPLEVVLSRLNGHRKQGNGYIGRCPAHEDKEASLSIAQGEDGRVLIKCFAGCGAKEIVGALGLKLKDLFPAAGINHGGITLEQYAAAKHLPRSFYEGLGWRIFFTVVDPPSASPT